MATFESFEDIEAWKEDRKLVQAVRKICKGTSASGDFAFVDRITRPCRSISANIAEGLESSSADEFVRFLGCAKSAAGETRSHLYNALDEHCITDTEVACCANSAIRISTMLASLMAYLRSPSVDRSKRRIKQQSLAGQTTRLPNQ